MSGNRRNPLPPGAFGFRYHVDCPKRQLPPVEDCKMVFKQPKIEEIDQDDDPVIIYEAFAQKKIPVNKASEEEVKRFINSYEESIRGIEKQTAIMQKYNEDFDFCMRHTNPENLRKLKYRRQGFISMMAQITEAQTSLLQDSNSIIEYSKRMETTFRIKKALEQEAYKRITVCVPNNVCIPRVTTSSKPEIRDNFQRILKRFYVMEDKYFRFMITMEGRKIPSIEDFMKLLTKPELVPVKFEKWTPELGEGIAHNSDLQTRFRSLNYEETFQHNKLKIVYDEHYLKSPEELRRRLDDQENILEGEEREEQKLEDSVTAIMNQFRKVQLQHLAVKMQLEKQQKVQSELDEIEKSMKRVQDLIRNQFNTVQKECPVCLLEFTNGIDSERCPVVWQCGHTSCKACSRTIANNAKPNKPQCPVCRKNHTLSSFIPNFGLMPKPI